jgi:hypothetical protein
MSEGIQKKIVMEISNILHSIPYLITLFAICVVATIIVKDFFNIGVGTIGFVILASVISAVVIFVDFSLLFRPKKEGKLIVTPTLVILFAVIFLLVFPFAIVYFAITNHKELGDTGEYMATEYPVKVETFTYKMSPGATGC